MEVSKGLNDLEKYLLNLCLRLQRHLIGSMSLKVFCFLKAIRDWRNYSNLTNEEDMNDNYIASPNYSLLLFFFTPPRVENRIRYSLKKYTHITEMKILNSSLRHYTSLYLSTKSDSDLLFLRRVLVSY